MLKNGSVFDILGYIVGVITTFPFCIDDDKWSGWLVLDDVGRGLGAAFIAGEIF